MTVEAARSRLKRWWVPRVNHSAQRTIAHLLWARIYEASLENALLCAVPYFANAKGHARLSPAECHQPS
jgi:hypothetical protein